MNRLLLITPARDEAVHLVGTIRAVAAQTRKPDLWLVIDDGSTDGTAEILERMAAEVPFMRVLQAPQHENDPETDRLTLAAEARVEKAGSTLGYIECEVKDQSGKLVAKAASTCMKLRPDRKDG